MQTQHAPQQPKPLQYQPPSQQQQQQQLVNILKSQL